MTPPRGTRPERWGVAPLLYLGSLAILLYGTASSPWRYGDPRFVVDFFWVEAAVLLLLCATFLALPGWKVGLRRPALVEPGLTVPMAVMVGAAFLAWVVARSTLPPGATLDRSMALPILRTTVLVGITEEWVYRGLALAYLARCLGLRRGAYVSLLLFGALHLINMAAGVAPAASAVQVLNTTIVGSTLLLGAVGTGSLLVPMIAHGLYDALVIDLGRYTAAGAPPWITLVAFLPTLLAGIYALVRIRGLTGAAPFPPVEEEGPAHLR